VSLNLAHPVGAMRRYSSRLSCTGTYYMSNR